jgi:hypothetical protein
MPRTWLLFMLAVVAGVAVLYDRSRPSTVEVEALAGRIAPDLRRDQVKGVTIFGPQGALRFERASDGFQLHGHPADLDGLLSALEFGSVLRRVRGLDPKERERLGLSAPRITLEVDGWQIRFGDDAPGTRGVYAIRSGDPDVLVAERRLYELADRPAAAFLRGTDAGR